MHKYETKRYRSCIFLVAELPVSSPLAQSVLKTLETWEELLLARLNLFSGPPVDYIPGCYPDASAGQLANKYRDLLEPGNTPFL